ncbi:MAG: hypothetical protein Q4B31_05525 [Clostridia bacterium]|nr:hypothetical protein [Clostridia bacterium]
MHRKCYPNIAEVFNPAVVNQVTFGEKWSVFCDLGNGAYLLVRHILDKIQFAPLFIISFPLLAPHTLLEAQKFNIRFSDPSQITEIADKLRYYRYKKALLQKEVADYLGIERTTYSAYEQYGRDFYPMENLEKIAVLYEVHVLSLLDEFNTFLYNDQGKQVKAMRKALNMTQWEFSKHLGVGLHNVKQWETNKARMFKSTWERLFK